MGDGLHGTLYEDAVIAQRLVGAAMRKPAVMRDLLSIGVVEADFIVESIRIMWSAGVALFEEHGVISPDLLATMMEIRGLSFDDATAIVDYAHAHAFTASDVDALRANVSQMRKRVAGRRLLELGRRLTKDAERGIDAPGLLAVQIEREARAIALGAVDVRGANAKEMAARAMDRLTRGRPRFDTVALSIPEIDAALDGGAPVGRVTVVMAGTGGGKSTLAKHVVHAMAARGEPVLWFTFESDRDEVADGLIEVEAGVRFPRDPSTSPLGTQSRLAEATAKFSTWPIFVEDVSDVPVEQIIALARTYRERHGVRVVVVDYVQDVAPSTKHGRDDLNHAHVARALRNLAKDDLFALIEFSQVGTRALDPKRKAPLGPDDVADSRQYAKDAAVILIMERDRDSKEEARRNLNRVKMVKNRITGKLAEAWLKFDTATTRMVPCDEGGEPLDEKRAREEAEDAPLFHLPAHAPAPEPVGGVLFDDDDYIDSREPG